MKRLITFKDWILTKESSPATRSKQQAALGLGPDYASVFGHSTPPPWQVERLLKGNKKSKKKNKKLPGEDPPKPMWTIPEKVQSPDYSFDKWLQDAMHKSKETEEDKAKAEKEGEKLDKEIADKKEKKEKEDTAPSEDKNPKNDIVGKDAKWSGQEKNHGRDSEEDSELES